MSELEPAWPPIESRSTTSVSSPSDDAYTAAPSPAGPAPTTATSKSRCSPRLVFTPYAPATSALVGSTSTRPPTPITTGSRVPS